MTRGNGDKVLIEAQQVLARAKKLELALVLEQRKRTVIERKLREQARELQMVKEQLRRAAAENKQLKEQQLYDAV